MIRLSNYFLCIISTVLLLTLSPILLAQNTGTIRGIVTDSDNSPLIGANVTLEGTTLGAATDLDGAYVILNVPTGDYTVMVSYLSYKSATTEVSVAAGSSADANFSLENDLLDLTTVVTTGVANKQSKLESSVSISTLDIIETEKLAPRTTAEIFRSIPGIRAEASGGDGNTNITVRGVPISAGGSKYLQLQEDGLPIFQFGDIAFATADIFLRADRTVARIEAIRGGSASTFASNSPAGIINFISKTGAVEGGSISTSTGIDYNSYRTDFEYGSPLGNSLSFHVGGFLRQGEGARTAGYTGNLGGQVKMNITKLFDGGYGRIYLKYLNDRALGYLPMPLQVTGTNASPEWGSIEGFDAVSGTMHSPFIQQNFGLGPDGAPRRADVTDGMHSLTKSIGIEFSKDMGDGWSFENRGRMAFNSGRFVSPFPSQVGPAQELADDIGGAGATLRYADGSAFGNGNAGNGLALRIHMFDTELNNFNNLANDIRVSKTIDKATITAGYYISNQSINMSWLWNSYLTDVNGDGARPVDVIAADGTELSQNGQYAYGVPFWGNCCTRNYDTNYLTNAPYVNADIQVNEAFNLDVSARLDNGQVTGHFAGSAQAEIDVNNDGVISANETSVSSIDNANITPVDYSYDYVSYSVGANFKLNDQQAVFGRYSHGGAAKADRLLFAGLPYSDGTTLNAKDLIDQAEVGYKHLLKNGGLFITGFMANTTEEGGFEATTQNVIENDYTAFGVEVEGAYNFGDFDLRGALIYTKAEISSGDNDGNTPRRQPDLMFNLVPQFSIGAHSVGASILGQSKAYAQDSNELVLPAYAYVNAFVNVQITNNFFASVNGNNILNSIGITESEEGSITDNQVNYVRARSIVGRSAVFTLGYNF